MDFIRSYCYFNSYVDNWNDYALVRRKFLTKEFYEEKFPQYKQLIKVMKPDGGYPDDGQERLASKLTMNNGLFSIIIEEHINYLEVILFKFI